MVVLTFGHGLADGEQIVKLLVDAGVRSLVDVRAAPGSRRNPDAARSNLERVLPEAGIAYRWDQRLGGWRKEPSNSPDTALRNASFRAYAAYMRTTEFVGAADELLAGAEKRLTAIMCAETVWWRCHRKLVSDFLVVTGRAEVRHLMHDGRVMPHRPSPEARLLPDGLVVYDGGQRSLPR